MSPTTEQQILNHVLELKAQVGELTGKVDGALQREDAQDSRLNDHTRRLRLLEHYAWFVAAVIVILSFMLYNISAVHTAAETLEQHKMKMQQQTNEPTTNSQAVH